MSTSRSVGITRQAGELTGIGVLDALDVPIVLMGLDLTVICFNRAASAALGLGHAHIGRSPDDVEVFAAVPDLKQLCERVIADGTAYRREISHEGRWFVLRIAPYSRDSEQIEAVVLTLTNVTAFRASIEQAVHDREYTKMILNTVVEPLLVLDAELLVQTANRAFYAMFGVSREEAHGVSLAELRNHRWDDPSLWERLRETLFEKRDISTLEIEHDFPVIGNRTLLLDARRLSSEAGSKPLVLLAFRDITERKQAEEQLRRTLAELDEAAEALRQSDRKKDQFLAVLAHELRNPLGPVRYAAHYLKSNEFPEKFQRPLGMIDRQVAHMARLLDDLLDVSRISRGMLELRREQLDFHEIATAVVDSCREEIEGQGHTLSVELPEAPLPLDADRDRLIQVFSNVISNAVKYTPHRGRIEFTACRNDDALEVLVSDNGIGIPQEKLSDIFELFEQVDRSLERHGGLGIGLALARDLVQLHGGNIKARSSGLGHGTTIMVRLPIALGSPATTTVDERSSATAMPYRILVADDNEDAAESLALLLETAGHSVRVAGDGEAALNVAAAFRPEVAFMDIGMPRMNGYDAARKIRQES